MKNSAHDYVIELTTFISGNTITRRMTTKVTPTSQNCKYFVILHNTLNHLSQRVIVYLHFGYIYIARSQISFYSIFLLKSVSRPSSRFHVICLENARHNVGCFSKPLIYSVTEWPNENFKLPVSYVAINLLN